MGTIEGFIFLGDGGRQWLEAHPVDDAVRRLGRLSAIVPAAQNHHVALLDACIAFYPSHLQNCPSFTTVEGEIGELERLDFDLAPAEVPGAWAALREGARPVFRSMNIWRAALIPLAEPG